LRRALRIVAVVLGIALIALVVVVTIKTMGLHSRQPRVESRPNEFRGGAAAAERLARALRLKTVSLDGQPTESAAFAELHALMQAAYPAVHEQGRREIIGGSSLLFTIEGADSAAAPAIFLAHMDVVPARAGEWSVDPFAGIIKDGYVWGRGALDDKSSVMGLMEACEVLLASGWRPARTIYLAFGHDEEIGGEDGAANLASRLRERGVQAEFVLDEGLPITVGVLDGVDVPLALIGVAEKGFANIELIATGPGGHGSMPGRDNATARLARALVRLEEAPFPAAITGPVASMFDFIAPEMPLARRVALANLWLTGRFVRSQLSEKAASNALIRTTVAPTMLSASEKPNVLATRASATLNVRIHPDSTVAETVAGIRRRIDDARISVAVIEGPSTAEPSQVADVESAAFERLMRTIRGSLDPRTVVAPGLVVGQTDSRHFEPVAENIYRFAPYVLTPEDLPRFHGPNERIAVDVYTDMIWFYMELLRAL